MIRIGIFPRRCTVKPDQSHLEEGCCCGPFDSQIHFASREVTLLLYEHLGTDVIAPFHQLRGITQDDLMLWRRHGASMSSERTRSKSALDAFVSNGVSQPLESRAGQVVRTCVHFEDERGRGGERERREARDLGGYRQCRGKQCNKTWGYRKPSAKGLFSWRGLW